MASPDTQAGLLRSAVVARFAEKRPKASYRGARNDRKGTWNVVAIDVGSQQQQERTFEVR